MVFDRTEHEPDEWDPEEDLRDPDSDSLTIPEVPTENAGSDLRSDMQSEFGSSAEAEHGPSTVETDVPAELLKTFWSIVLVVNAAVLAVSLGVLFLLFDGATTQSGVLIAGGMVLFGFAVRRYRAYRASDDSSEADQIETETAGSEPPADHTQSNATETNSDEQSESRSPDDPDRP